MYCFENRAYDIAVTLCHPANPFRNFTSGT